MGSRLPLGEAGGGEPLRDSSRSTHTQNRAAPPGEAGRPDSRCGRWGGGPHGLSASHPHAASSGDPAPGTCPAEFSQYLSQSCTATPQAGIAICSECLQGSLGPHLTSGCSCRDTSGWRGRRRTLGRGGDSGPPSGVVSCFSVSLLHPASSPSPSCFSHLSPGISRSREDPLPKASVATTAGRGGPATPGPTTSTVWAPVAPSPPRATGGHLGTAPPFSSLLVPAAVCLVLLL